MNELCRAIRRARAIQPDEPRAPSKYSRREKLIWLSLTHQGYSEKHIQDKIDRLRAIEAMPDDEARPMLAHIVRACCTHYGVTEEEFLSPSRYAKPVRARQVAFYLAKTMTNRTLIVIGRYMNKDRGSVEFGYGAICSRMQDDDGLLSDIEHIKKEIKNYVMDEAIKGVIREEDQDQELGPVSAL